MASLKTNDLLHPPKEGGDVLPLCLFACPLDYSKSYEQIFINFFGGVGHGPRNNRLYGDDPDHSRDSRLLDSNHDTDPRLFKRFFYFLLQFLQTVKSKTCKSSAKFELPDCFLVTYGHHQRKLITVTVKCITCSPASTELRF